MSKRIRITKLLLMAMVVYIHAFSGYAAFLEGIDTGKYSLLLPIPAFLSHIVLRCAVPMFFLFAGMLLYQKPFLWRQNIQRKTYTVLLPYLLWNLFWILLFIAGQHFKALAPYFNGNAAMPNKDPVSWLQAFWGWPAGPGLPFYPFYYPFWFLKDLFVLNVLAKLIEKLITRIPLLFLFLCLFLWIYNIDIYLFTAEALCFFALGGYIARYRIPIQSIDSLKMADVVLAFLSCAIMEFFYYERWPLLHKASILLGILFFLKLSKNLLHSPAFPLLEKLAPYTFIIYACHEYTLTFLFKLSRRFIPASASAALLLYMLLPVFVLLCCMAAGFLLQKTCPFLYKLSTGGR